MNKYHVVFYLNADEMGPSHGKNYEAANEIKALQDWREEYKEHKTLTFVSVHIIRVN